LWRCDESIGCLGGHGVEGLVGEGWSFVDAVLVEEAEVETDEAHEPVLVLGAAVAVGLVKACVLESGERGGGEGGVFSVVFVALG